MAPKRLGNASPARGIARPRGRERRLGPRIRTPPLRLGCRPRARRVSRHDVASVWLTVDGQSGKDAGETENVARGRLCRQKPSCRTTARRNRNIVRRVTNMAAQICTECPEPVKLRRLIDGALAADEQSQITAHLDCCELCQKIEHLAGGNIRTSQLRLRFGQGPPGKRVGLLARHAATGTRNR